MAITYTINSGQELEFFIPGRCQNMRWATHSVSICWVFYSGNPSNIFSVMAFQQVSIKMISVAQDSSQDMILYG